MHVRETEGATELINVSSRTDDRLAGQKDRLSRPSKVTDALSDAVSRFKRHVDFNEMYKEAAKT